MTLGVPCPVSKDDALKDDRAVVLQALPQGAELIDGVVKYLLRRDFVATSMGLLWTNQFFLLESHKGFLNAVHMETLGETYGTMKLLYVLKLMGSPILGKPLGDKVKMDSIPHPE